MPQAALLISAAPAELGLEECHHRCVWCLILRFRLQGPRSALPECLARVPEDLRIHPCLKLPPLSVGARGAVESTRFVSCLSYAASTVNKYS